MGPEEEDGRTKREKNGYIEGKGADIGQGEQWRSEMKARESNHVSSR